MPTISKLFVRAALIYMVLALSLGVFGLASPAVLHLFMVGWVTQIIFGVALWMFPRPKGVKKPARPTALELVCLIALNLGLLLRLVAEPYAVDYPALVVASAVLQWLAGMAFIVAIWPRVR
ncbi:MAG: hypothetical protein H0U74_00315 [Bradymonadaceae bacterium]|nr:hypothetical protein [Lujinxingiaceae bacterium]